MALLPEVHIHFGQLTFERIYQVFLPLVPGATLVGGLMLAHPTSAQSAVLAFGIGRYLGYAILVCAAYIVGLMLYRFSTLSAGIVTGTLNTIVVRKWPPRRQNLASSQTTLFRRVAAEFLGSSLAPPPTNPPLSGNDVEWQDWYNILQDYVLRDAVGRLNEYTLLFLHLQATGWALLYLYFTTILRVHRSALILSLSLVTLGAAVVFLTSYNYWRNDRLSPWDFVARLVYGIRRRSQ